MLGLKLNHVSKRGHLTVTADPLTKQLDKPDNTKGQIGAL